MLVASEMCEDVRGPNDVAPSLAHDATFADAK